METCCRETERETVSSHYSDRHSNMSQTLLCFSPPSFIAAPPVSALIWGHLSALPANHMAGCVPPRDAMGPVQAWGFSEGSNRLAGDKGQRPRKREGVKTKNTNNNNKNKWRRAAEDRQEVNDRGGQRKIRKKERLRFKLCCCKWRSVTFEPLEETRWGWELR